MIFYGDVHIVSLSEHGHSMNRQQYLSEGPTVRNFTEQKFIAWKLDPSKKHRPISDTFFITVKIFFAQSHKEAEMKTLTLTSTLELPCSSNIASRTGGKTYTDHSKLIALPKNCGLFRSYALSALQQTH